MTENNMQQAYLPKGCTVFYNSLRHQLPVVDLRRRESTS